jgi:hypothetical protein
MHLAAESLVRARLRSVMMLIAMSIGVAAVVVLTSLGEGARRYVTGEFQALGTDLLIVLPGSSETTGVQPGLFAGETLKAAQAAQREREEADRRMAAAAAIETTGMADVADTIMESALDSQAVAEKLDRVSTGSAADLVRTQTAGGTVTSATTLAFEVTDNDALRASMGELGPYFGQPEIDKAIRAYVAAAKRMGKDAGTIKPLAGVRFFADRSARVR